MILPYVYVCKLVPEFVGFITVGSWLECRSQFLMHNCFLAVICTEKNKVERYSLVEVCLFDFFWFLGLANATGTLRRNFRYRSKFYFFEFLDFI